MVIVVITGVGFITILRSFTPIPEIFVAPTAKLYVPALVGIPEITPVFPFKFKPSGKVPMGIDQDIGVVLVAIIV